MFGPSFPHPNIPHTIRSDNDIKKQILLSLKPSQTIRLVGRKIGCSFLSGPKKTKKTKTEKPKAAGFPFQSEAIVETMKIFFFSKKARFGSVNHATISKPMLGFTVTLVSTLLSYILILANDLALGLYYVHI